MKLIEKWIWPFAIAAIVGCVGGEPSPLPPEAAPPAAGQQETEQTPAPEPETPPAQAPAASPAEQTSPPQAPQAQKAQAYDTVAAKRGVGKKGQGYGGGIITQPISTYFITRDRMAFEVKIPHSMKHYHAQHGRYPKDMEEFEAQILKPAAITLPPLPDGHWYLFDPEQIDLSQGETGLRVARPK